MRKYLTKWTATLLIVACAVLIGLSSLVIAENDATSSSSSDQSSGQTGRQSDLSAQRAVTGSDSTATESGSGSSGGGLIHATLPSGISSTQTSDPDEIHRVLKEATKALLTRGGINQLVNQLERSDRERVASTLSEASDFDRAAEQFQQQWKEKFSKEFDVNVEQAFAAEFMVIVEGTVDDAAQINNWPMNPRRGSGSSPQSSSGRPSFGATAGGQDAVGEGASDQSSSDQSSANQSSSGQNATEQGKSSISSSSSQSTSDQSSSGSSSQSSTEHDKAGDHGLSKGTAVAVVSLLGEPAMAPIDVTFVKEGASWKIDIPDAVTGEQLKAGLKTHVGHINSLFKEWPVDQQTTARYAAHHVLMGLYGVDAADMDSMSGQSGQNGSQSGISGSNESSDSGSAPSSGSTSDSESKINAGTSSSGSGSTETSENSSGSETGSSSSNSDSGSQSGSSSSSQ